MSVVINSYQRGRPSSVEAATVIETSRAEEELDPFDSVGSRFSQLVFLSWARRRAASATTRDDHQARHAHHAQRARHAHDANDSSATGMFPVAGSRRPR